jgi:hypothetical protein
LRRLIQTRDMEGQQQTHSSTTGKGALKKVYRGYEGIQRHWCDALKDNVHVNQFSCVATSFS